MLNLSPAPFSTFAGLFISFWRTSAQEIACYSLCRTLYFRYLASPFFLTAFPHFNKIPLNSNHIFWQAQIFLSFTAHELSFLGHHLTHSWKILVSPGSRKTAWTQGMIKSPPSPAAHSGFDAAQGRGDFVALLRSIFHPPAVPTSFCAWQVPACSDFGDCPVWEQSLAFVLVELSDVSMHPPSPLPKRIYWWINSFKLWFLSQFYSIFI